MKKSAEILGYRLLALGKAKTFHIEAITPEDETAAEGQEKEDIWKVWRSGQAKVISGR